MASSNVSDLAMNYSWEHKCFYSSENTMDDLSGGYHSIIEPPVEALNQISSSVSVQATSTLKRVLGFMEIV